MKRVCTIIVFYAYILVYLEVLGSDSGVYPIILSTIQNNNNVMCNYFKGMGSNIINISVLVFIDGLIEDRYPDTVTKYVYV